MAKSKKDFTLLLIALFCSSLAHAQSKFLQNGKIPLTMEVIL